ncbi:hypothetical protein Ddc_10479 [Ditylenchus destructor]|nr:hypothetical protein Ddc_10479 [Ditylenchus destructor]
MRGNDPKCVGRPASPFLVECNPGKAVHSSRHPSAFSMAAKMKFSSFATVFVSVALISVFNMEEIDGYAIIDGPSWEAEYPETRYSSSHEAALVRSKLLQALMESDAAREPATVPNKADNLKPMVARQRMKTAISKNDLDKITYAMRNRLFGF